MKVVLFCGGLGLRFRDDAPDTPKPLGMIGDRPILWHLMSYYAHFGHKEFILCLGYRAAAIKAYFVCGGREPEPGSPAAEELEKVDVVHDYQGDWTIRFVDSGLDSNVGMRLLSARELLDDEPFFANYADGLTDLPLDAYVRDFERSGAVASFLSVPPKMAFHVVDADEAGWVREVTPGTECGLRINGGFFVFLPEFFDSIRPGEELVHEPFARLAAKRMLFAHRYDGFWQCMDTFKEKKLLEELLEGDRAPWQLWKPGRRD